MVRFRSRLGSQRPLALPRVLAMVRPLDKLSGIILTPHPREVSEAFSRGDPWVQNDGFISVQATQRGDQIAYISES